MAAYKLEDDIREKLEERELKPSNNAWEKLEMRLDAQQPRKKSYVWFYVAASLVGIAFLSSVFVYNNSVSSEIQIVQTNVKGKSSEIEQVLMENNIEEETSKKQEIKPEEKSTIILKPTISKKSAIEKKKERTQIATNVSTESEKASIETQNTEILEEEIIFKNKVEEVVAQIQNLESSSEEVMLEEVESLLENARREVQLNRILHSNKVDAMALLKDVEWELEKSFRDKVFDALGDGFQKIRTAYLERNN